MFSGSRVRQVRELRGLTQSELADRIGVKTIMVVYFETDRLMPPDGILRAISQETDFPVSFFNLGPALQFPLGSLLLHRDKGLGES